MCAAARRLRKRLGRRGVALAILGVAKVCFGLGYALQPEPTPAGLGLLTGFKPIQTWSWVWIVCGLITFCCGFLRVGRDSLGFITAMIPPLVWGFAFAWGALAGDYERGFAIAAWYAVGHVGLILWAASVPEYSLPSPYLRRERR